MKKNLTKPVFISPGANSDAVGTSGRFGIDADRAAATPRECGAVPAVCPDEIREDMKERGGRR